MSDFTSNQSISSEVTTWNLKLFEVERTWYSNVSDFASIDTVVASRARRGVVTFIAWSKGVEPTRRREKGEDAKTPDSVFEPRLNSFLRGVLRDSDSFMGVVNLVM